MFLFHKQQMSMLTSIFICFIHPPYPTQNINRTYHIIVYHYNSSTQLWKKCI